MAFTQQDLDNALSTGVIGQAEYDERIAELAPPEPAAAPPEPEPTTVETVGRRGDRQVRSTIVQQSYRRSPGESIEQWRARTGQAVPQETVEVRTGTGRNNATEAIPVSRTRADSEKQAVYHEMYKGAITPGNVDLFHRPAAMNPDGSISSVRSMSFSDYEGGPEILIPTVSPDGRILSNEDAIALYDKTGQHLGIYPDVPTANAAAERIHQQQAALTPPDNKDQAQAPQSQGPMANLGARTEANVAAPGGQRFVDPTGADSPIAQSKAQLEQLALLEAQNPNARIGGGHSAMVPVGANVQTQQTLPTQGEIDATAQYENALRTQSQLDEQQVQREVAGAQKVAAVEASKAQIAEQQAAEAAARQTEINADTDKRMRLFDAAVDDYTKSAKEGIDPNRYWNQKSTGSKIGASLAIMLSGLGAGLQGGKENLALRQINDAIDRDIQAQVVGLSAKAHGVSVSGNAVQAAMNAGASKMDAINVVHTKQLEAANQKIVAAMAATKVPDQKEMLGRLHAQLEQQIAQNRMQLAASTRQTVVSSVQQRRVTTGGLTVAQAADRARAVVGSPKFDNKLYSPTLETQFSDVETRRANEEKARNMKNLKTLTSDLRGLRKKYGVNWFDRIGRAKADAYANQLAVAMTVANQQGAMSRGDAEVSNSITTGGGNALDLMSTVMARTDVLDRIADVTIQSLKDEGMEPDRVPPVYKVRQRARQRLDELQASKGYYQ